MQGEPRILSPIYESAYHSPIGATDDDSTNSSLGHSSVISPAISCGAAYLNTGRVDPVRCEGRTLEESQEALSTLVQSETQKLQFLLTQKADSSYAENSYLSQWYAHVVACLPPIFRDMTADMANFPPLRSAVLAISASYVAHVESSTVTTNVGGRRSRYIPQPEHRYRSLEFYDRGIRELAKLVLTPRPANIHHVLTTSLLFHYFGIDSGSVMGTGGHMESIDNIVFSAYKDLKATLTGQRLLCAWMVQRSLVVSRRISIGIGLPELPSFMSLNDLDSIMSKAATPYDSIMQLLCVSMSNCRVVILDWCACRGTSFMTPEEKHKAFDGILDQVCLPQSRNCSISELAAIDKSYCKSFEEQRAKLDEWHSRLHVSELPIESFTSQTSDIIANDTTLDPHVPPLRFQTHDAAMNYLYYALAQMLSSRRILEGVATTDAPPASFTSRDYPWEYLILRIITGLDLADCVAKHMFMPGVMSILSLCAGWCPHIGVAKASERWISQFEVCGLAIEDGLPLTIRKRELKFILEKKKLDQDVFRVAVLARADTEAGELYQSDFQLLSAVCAKDRRTGKLYNYMCDIP